MWFPSANCIWLQPGRGALGVLRLAVQLRHAVVNEVNVIALRESSVQVGEVMRAPSFISATNEMVNASPPPGSTAQSGPDRERAKTAYPLPWPRFPPSVMRKAKAVSPSSKASGRAAIGFKIGVFFPFFCTWWACDSFENWGTAFRKGPETALQGLYMRIGYSRQEKRKGLALIRCPTSLSPESQASPFSRWAPHGPGPGPQPEGRFWRFFLGPARAAAPSRPSRTL